MICRYKYPTGQRLKRLIRSNKSVFLNWWTPKTAKNHSNNHILNGINYVHYFYLAFHRIEANSPRAIWWRIINSLCRCDNVLYLTFEPKYKNIFFVLRLGSSIHIRTCNIFTFTRLLWGWRRHCSNAFVITSINCIFGCTFSIELPCQRYHYLWCGSTYIGICRVHAKIGYQ